MGLPYFLAPKHKFACQNLIQGRTFGEVSRIGWGVGATAKPSSR